MPKPEQLLEAGALLAPKTKLKDAAGIDEVSARAYRHPALGDRVVVRLTPDNLAAGEDLTLSFLGFAEPDVTGPVAVRRRQALGFPEWALVHDPAHARYALDMVKEFKREARRAKSKPGHAWDAFSEIAKSLGKSVAHFLPSFWEQVGREFIAIDNSTYASRAFGKAREAERVHGLKVDEAIRRDAFLEFALAGCVSASAINDYGKELQAAGDAGEAWSIIRDLSVRRTLGGLPPWKNMCKDLATLAKAAGLDVDTEIQQVVRELLESPAMPRTSMGFWQVASKWVQSLAGNDDQAAGLLLNMIPKSGGYAQSDAWTWLNYLETWGILDNSWKDGVSEQAGPVGSPAEWLSKLCAVGSPSQILFDLVERMADRLKKDDISVYPYEVNRWNKQLNANIDLLDHLLALGIPIADPEGELRLSMYSWFRVHDDNAKNRPRDPVMLAQDPRFSVALMDAVRESVGVAEFEAAATGKKAMLEVRRNWLLSEIEKFGKAALPGFEDAFSTINGKTTTATWQEFPEAFERLQEAKVAAALHRSLKNGLMDEYGWPALEAAFEHFTGKFSISAPRETASDVKLFGAYPYAVVTDGVAAIVVRGNERVGEFELKLPKGEPLKHVEYIDGDLLVTAGKNYRCKQFWNRSPGKSWETWERDNQGLQGFAIDARGGGAFTGEKIIHAGEPETRGIGSSSNFFFDGEHYWATGWDHASQTETSCELDPVKGEQGRRSLPGFLEDFIAPDTRLMLHRCSLFPLPSGIQHSPLGQKDGLCGFRARKDSVTLQFTAEGIDGRSICTGKDDLSFQALLDQPGTTQKLPIEGVEGRWRTAPHLALHSPDNQIVTSRPEFDPGMYNSGQPAGIPWRYLNFFEVRDETASKKLRSISLDDTQTLLDAASKDIEAIASKREAKQGKKAENPTYPLLDKAIGKLLPRLKSPRLHAGIRGIIVGAIQLQLSLEKVIAQSDPNRVQPTKITVTNADASVVHVLNMLQKRSYGAESVSFFNELASIVMFLQGESDDITAPDFTCGIFGEIVSESLLNAWQLQWFARDDGDTKWLTFYEALLQTGALSLTGRLRQFSIDEDSDPKFRKLLEDAVGGRHDDIDDREAATALQHGNSKFVITRDWRGFNVVEFSRSETFHPVTGVDSNEETQPLELSDIQESVQQFIDLCKDQPPKIPSADFFAEVAEGMKLKPAIVAYIWFGYPHFGRYGSDPIPAYLREPA
ncbi:MAG: hypothetical protein KDA91_23230, partial [Planctomycetaceae bacterium]|nr:hypothetical protein [Planctomycetaceae bacterium]